MAVLQDVRLGDRGTVFRATAKDGAAVVPLASYTTVQMLFRKPTGATVTKTAAFVTDGSDGKFQYVTIAGDIDQTGNWQVQGRIAKAGEQFSSEIHTFAVGPIL